MNYNYGAAAALSVAAVILFLTGTTSLGAVFLAVGAVFFALAAKKGSETD